MTDIDTIDIDAEIGALVKHERRAHKDIAPHFINKPVETVQTPGPVQNFLGNFQKVQEDTARRTLELADWFEQQAAILKNHAAILIQQAKQIPDDVKNATTFEINVRSRVDFLSVLKE